MDFQQGLITTVHDYGFSGAAPESFHQQLRDRPTALLLPCLMEEFRRPALRLIREVLSGLDGLQSLVIALAADSVDEVLEALVHPGVRGRDVVQHKVRYEETSAA